ncbi:MAG: phospholipase C, phosphocholine-specific [Rubrivivax sp.]|nr:phospholipase C, phosphocholine-specific [Rubrivivax sp.]
MTLDRRRFLHGLGGSAAGLALIRQAQAVPPSQRTGTLADVDHIVVLTQENRAFDHYFGALPGVRGFADPHPVPLPGGHTVWSQPRASKAGPASATSATPSPRLAPFHLDTRAQPHLMRSAGTPHRWPDAQQAWDHGRMADWPAAKENHTMAFFAPADIPFQTALAEAFTLCDAYHCSFQGGTWPNRLFLFTGTNDPQGTGGGPALYNEYEDFGKAEQDQGYTWMTYAQRLQAAGVSWQVYQDVADNFGDNPLAGFRIFRDAYHARTGHAPALRERAATTRALDALRDDVLAGRLPAVSWVVAPVADSEHPWKSSPAQGADYTARVMAALLANPAVWARTVLLVNYDENDGFFDHVPPPAPPAVLQWHDVAARRQVAGHSMVDTTGEYHQRLAPEHPEQAERRWLHHPYGLGPRVPMWVISPWSRGGWVCSEVFDHTSVLRFIERRFGVAEPQISPWRRAVCGDLTGAFDFATPQAAVQTLRLPETLAAAQAAGRFTDTPVPAQPLGLEAPAQPAGPRPARALPYAVQAHATVQAQGVRIDFHNRSRTAVVVHVYNRLNLQAAPRRYTLLAGARWHDHWAADREGRYDLWLLGPNGWHRHLAGRAGVQVPHVSLQQQARSLSLRLANPGPQRARLRISALAYGQADAVIVSVPAGQQRAHRLALAPHHWYDWRVDWIEVPTTAWRFAGHLEDGQPSLTDPAMHGHARLQHADGVPTEFRA